MKQKEEKKENAGKQCNKTFLERQAATALATHADGPRGGRPGDCGRNRVPPGKRLDIHSIRVLEELFRIVNSE